MFTAVPRVWYVNARVTLEMQVSHVLLHYRNVILYSCFGSYVFAYWVLYSNALSFPVITPAVQCFKSKQTYSKFIQTHCVYTWGRWWDLQSLASCFYIFHSAAWQHCVTAIDFSACFYLPWFSPLWVVYSSHPTRSHHATSHSKLMSPGFTSIQHKTRLFFVSARIK